MKAIQTTRTHRPHAVLMVLMLLPLFAPEIAATQTRRVPDTFTATTTGMTPAGVTLKIDVFEWPDDEARAAVMPVLARGQDTQDALTRLPTVGYVWPSSGSVGYALKYAHRTTTPDGGERVTVVTDRPVGTYEHRPWSAGDEPAPNTAHYSVIELYLDSEGNGVGTMSLAAHVITDPDTQTVSLTRAGSATNVLAAAKREPKPYWAELGAIR